MTPVRNMGILTLLHIPFLLNDEVSPTAKNIVHPPYQPEFATAPRYIDNKPLSLRLPPFLETNESEFPLREYHLSALMA